MVRKNSLSIAMMWYASTYLKLSLDIDIYQVPRGNSLAEHPINKIIVKRIGHSDFNSLCLHDPS